ncbi:MAG: HEAT repeat domain-containing protein [Planctomycetota bacterium]|jgi:HEAT repeat protein
MRIGLSLKLGIVVVAVFGIVMAGIFVYRPLKYARLKAKLVSEDAAEREAAVRTLADEGKRCITYLNRWLESQDNNLVIQACEVLKSTSTAVRKKSVSRLQSLLDGPPSRVTDAVFYVILRDCEYVKDCLKYCTNPERQRNFYCFVLRYPDNSQVERWHIGVQGASERLAVLNDSLSTGSLLEAFESKRDPLPVIIALNELGYDIRIGSIFSYANSIEVSNEKEARFFGKIGWKGAVPALINALGNCSDEYLAMDIADALGKLGDKECVDALFKAIDSVDEDDEGRLTYRIGWALSEIGREKLIKRLLALLGNEPGYERIGAIYALGRLGEERAIENLLEIVNSEIDWSHEWHNAAMALAKIGNDKVAEPLLRFIRVRNGDFDDDYYASLSARVLGIYGDKKCVTELIGLLDTTLKRDWTHESRDVAYHTVLGLAESGDERAVGALLKVFDSKEYQIAAYFAGGALSKFSKPDSFGKLEEVFPAIEADTKVRGFVSDPTTPAFENVLMAIGASGNENAIDFLIKQAEKDPDCLHVFLALSNFENDRVRTFLREMQDKKCINVVPALMWMGENPGPVAFERYCYSTLNILWNPTLGERAYYWMNPDPFYPEENYDLTYEFYVATAARWGRTSALERIICGLLTSPYELVPFYRKVFEHMPESFPGFDFNARYHERMKKKKEIMKWYNDNKDRLAWDGEKKRYYLKPE